MEEPSKYADILDHPRHISSRRAPMSMVDRAAQFAPFAALTGFEGVIAETGRLTQEETELTDAQIQQLDAKLQLLRDRLEARPTVEVCWFVPDGCKQGGAYVTARGQVLRMDLYRRKLLLAPDKWIPMDTICGLEGEVFSNMEL